LKFKKLLLLIIFIFSIFILSGCQIAFDDNGDIKIISDDQTQDVIEDENNQTTDPIIEPTEPVDPVEEPTEPVDPIVEPTEPVEECPAPTECPVVEECPAPTECPVVEECPAPEECPTCPTPEPCPTCPTPEPCPTCPEPVEPYLTEERLMETRNIIRESNIFITTTKYDKGFANTLIKTATSLGSGVVYKEDLSYYYAITNNHVIDGGDSYQVDYLVSTFEGHEMVGTVIIADSTYDLAVIRFEKNGYIIPLIDMSERENSNLTDSEFLLAVGNPSGVLNVVTFGLYKGMSNIANVSFSVINHSVLIYPGNSGGALTDLYGNLVGINTWGDENNNENNYAIPLINVREFLTNNQLL